MNFAASIVPLTGPLPKVKFRWDPETEILSGHFTGGKAAAGLTGSVELAGSDGSIIVLDVADGVVRGVEVVVWPDEVAISPGLTAPAVREQGSLTMPARRSQPGIAAVEVETLLTAVKSGDGSTVHFAVGRRREITAVQLADHLIVELDKGGDIAGFWLLHVPPFPEPDA